MNLRRPLALLTVALVPFASNQVSAKPPAKNSPSPAAASPTPGKPTANPTAAWLLQQNGGKDAITLPLSEVFRAATGKRALSFDAANPTDAAFLAKLGMVMDRVLPRMNRPGSPALAAALDNPGNEVLACFEREIVAVSQTVPGFAPRDEWDAFTPSGGYPGIRLVDAQSKKVYYVGIALYLSGKREEVTHAFRFDPTLPGLFSSDGCCLLIGIENNAGIPNQGGFLNWDVTDVSNVPVRAVVTFDANGADVYHPGAILTDGRKGND